MECIYKLRLIFIAAIGLASCETMKTHHEAGYTVQTTSPVASQSVDLAAYDAAAQARVKPYAGQLLAAVQSAIKQGGAPHAITVCTELAPALAKAASQDGWTVTRTTDKPRNPANRADAWDQMAMAAFRADAAQGKPLMGAYRSAVVDGEYRYAQAIVIQASCLTCHGRQIDPAVQRQLKQSYPQDQATGYELGELRGVFSARKPI